MESSNGVPLDSSTQRATNYGLYNFGINSGQLLQPSIHASPNDRHTFPIEFSGASEMMHDLSTLNHSRSVPVSPTMQWSSPGFDRMEHLAPSFGAFGHFETNYARGRDYVGDAGSFETTTTGIGMLEDAIRKQHFEQVIVLLEQGFSPNGEQGSSKAPPLLFAVSTGNERFVKLLLNVGANVNAWDSRQYTALHYAAAFGYRGIVYILLASGANIYAKTDGDLLPVQLAIDPAIYKYLSARMKLDMEDRMNLRQAKYPSSGLLNFSSFQRSASANQDQGTELGASNIATNRGSGYQDYEIMRDIHGFEECANMLPGIEGVERQSSLNSASQAVGSRLMEWESLKNSSPEPFHQGFVHSPNVASNEWSNVEFNQSMDVLMQDGTNYSKGSFIRPLPEQVLQEKLSLQRTSSAPAVPYQLDAWPQSIDFVEQKNYFANTTMLPVVPNAPSEFEQKAVDVLKNGLQKAVSLPQFMSTEAQKAPMHKSEKIGTKSSNTNYPQETKFSRIINDNEEVVSEGVDPQKVTTEIGKRFAHACNSMAPSMMEKFKSSTTSSCSFELHKIEEIFAENASGTPQAPETPRQVGEIQEKPDMQVMNSFQRASSSSKKGKTGFVDVPPTSALKGDERKMREKKKTVTFAIVNSPSKEDLVFICEDWHEDAQSGCGEDGCEEQCLAPKKLPSLSISDVVSCSSSKTDQEVSKTTRIGFVRWTRGELLGEGAYGKVFAGLNQDTGELMAVKQLKLDTAAEGQERQFYLAALEREISFYKTMRHKHIVGYIDMEQDLATGSLYIFLEYVSGGSIQSMLERFGRFSEPLVKVYTRQLLLGLEYLHGKKIVHRDIKGGNVLVDANGVIKLADFGASKAFHDPTQTDGFKSIRGSVFWMAPEVIKGDGYGRRADIWSVGCTVVEMLTAVHPWPGMDNTWTAIFHIAKASSGPPIPEGISKVVEDFLSLCFQLDPKKRPTSIELLQHPFVAETPYEA